MTKAKSAIEKAVDKAVRKGLRKAEKKFKPLHEFTKTLKGLDPTFQQFIDSAIEHMGKVAENTSLTEYAGLFMGLSFGVKTGAPPETIALLGASGLFAARGIDSQSEAVGVASLATLALFGAVSIGLPTVIKDTVIALRTEIETAIGLPVTGTLEQKEFLEKTGLGKVVFIP